MSCSERRTRTIQLTFNFKILDMHPLAAASRSRLLCSKRPIMRSALNVSLRKGDISRLQTNLKLTVLSNRKLCHFWAQIVSWAPRHARKSFIVLAPDRGSQFTERWRHLTCCNEPNCFYGLRLRLFTEWWRHRTDSGSKRAKVRTDQGRRVWHWIGNPLNTLGWGGSIFLGES